MHINNCISKGERGRNAIYRLDLKLCICSPGQRVLSIIATQKKKKKSLNDRFLAIFFVRYFNEVASFAVLLRASFFLFFYQRKKKSIM